MSTVAEVYLFGALIYFAAMTDQVNYGILLTKNETVYTYIGMNKSSGTTGHGCSASSVISLNGTTDFVELLVFQESTGAQTLLAGGGTLCNWWGCRIG